MSHICHYAQKIVRVTLSNLRVNGHISYLVIYE